MAQLAEKIENLLRSEFHGAEVTWEPGNRLAGVLTWDAFTGMSQAERQRRVWTVIRNAVPSADHLRILAILTVTPAEKAVMERELV